MTAAFEYGTAFARNLGWVVEGEQDKLRQARVAIAGLGGVGGSHLLTLTRLGVGRFTVADPDHFELANFNRQAGATMSSLGRHKVDTLVAMARDINPELEVRTLHRGVDPADPETFLAGADLYIDGLDFFAVEARRAVFAACERLRIPAVTAAPLGMGAALLCFMPGGMSFERYFRLEGCTAEEQALRFLVGLAPSALHAGYLVDRSRVDFNSRRGPSTAMACELCAGLAATEALRILLGRGGVVAAPHGLHVDAYRRRMRHTWIPFGNANPLQRLRIAIARRLIGRATARPASEAAGHVP